MEHSLKYTNLENYFRQSDNYRITLTFSKIETLLGFKLPPSAYKHPAFWSNSYSHPIAYSWLNSGYLSQDVNILEQTIVFSRKMVSAKKVSKNAVCQKLEKSSLMSTEDAIQLIMDYFNNTTKDKHSRYLSWEHCYKAFCNKRHLHNEQTTDYLSLHLAFYLASWGMYRGSSFLLQKDYKIHIPIVKIIQEQKYEPLLGISAIELCKESNLFLLDDISIRIKNYFSKESPSFDGTTNNATDTLVTKILLGTLGCVPAYDRYFIQSIRKHQISSGKYNSQSVYNIAKFYCNNWDAFEKLRHELSIHDIIYPPMKLMDMCFWQDAFSNDLNQQNS